MEEPEAARVLAFPAHRRSTLGETLEGFPGRAGDPTLPGTRRERRVTMVFSELRGWNDVAGRAGADAAGRLLGSAVERATAVMREFGPEEVKVGGTAKQPVVSATFEGADHADRAVRAAIALRAGVEGTRLAELADHGFRACSGINTGSLVSTELAGGVPVAFQAVGTVRMFASRLQEFAGPGQIFLAASTLEDADQRVRVRSIGPVRTNADGGASEAYCLVEAQDDAGTVRRRSG